jgi:hypothetical protein
LDRCFEKESVSEEQEIDTKGLLDKFGHKQIAEQNVPLQGVDHPALKEAVHLGDK